MSDLTEALLADGPALDLDDEEASARFEITDDALAEWALRKLAAAVSEASRLRRIAQAEIDRIQLWAEDAERIVGRDASFFTSKLIDYRRTLEARDPKLPGTYKLPAGSLKRAAGRESTKVLDEQSFVTWAIDNAPDALAPPKPLVSTMKTWPRTEAGEIVSPDGDKVPGVQVVKGDPSYTVVPADLSNEPF